jgi:hypothetical protein
MKEKHILTITKIAVYIVCAAAIILLATGCCSGAQRLEEAWHEVASDGELTAEDVAYYNAAVEFAADEERRRNPPMPTSGIPWLDMILVATGATGTGMVGLNAYRNRTRTTDPRVSNKLKEHA